MVCPSEVEVLESRLRDHLDSNFRPASGSDANVAVARLAIEMFLAGQRTEAVPGARGDWAGQVVENLRLHDFVHWCHFCEVSNGNGEYCPTCNGCQGCCECAHNQQG